MSNQDNSTITPGEMLAATLIGGGLLAVSIAQAGSYLWSWGSNPIEHLYLMSVVIFSLLSSQVLIRTAILNWKNSNHLIAIICILVCCGIETFSYKTTKLAMQGRAAETIRAENRNSPEYKKAEKNEARYERQLLSLEKSYRDTPADHSTARNRIAKNIQNMNTKILRAQQITGKVNVSITGAGMTDGGTGFATLIALLQSLIPIVINLSTMMVSAARRRGRTTTKVVRKKSQARRGNLKAVA